jgi:hypothetical protein
VSGTTITYSDLLNFPQSPAQDTAESWDELLEGITASAQDLDAQVKPPINNEWQGVAAQLAGQTVTQTHGELLASKDKVGQISTLLKNYYNNMQWLSSDLNAISEHPDEGQNGPFADPGYKPIPKNLASTCLLLNGNGVVGLQGTTTALSGSYGYSATQILAAQKEWQDGIDYYVQKANDQDSQTAAELLKLVPQTSSNPNPSKQPPATMGGGNVSVTSWPDPSASLWGIAEQKYGNGAYWPLIYEANKGKFGGSWGPNDIQAGWSIDVPAIKRNTPLPTPPANTSNSA